jgi:hypothetical protein
MVPLGDDKYRAEFAVKTQPGGTYTIQIGYQVNTYLDTTTIDGLPYRVVAWAPPQWALPIDEQIVTFIFPIELATEVSQPEMVTDDIVDNARIVVSENTVSQFDRWI